MLEFAIAAAPFLLLLLLLLCGRYPGCAVALRLAERFASRARARTTATSWRRPQPPASRAVRGGLLLAVGLSGRAPPA